MARTWAGFRAFFGSPPGAFPYPGRDRPPAGAAGYSPPQQKLNSGRHRVLPPPTLATPAALRRRFRPGKTVLVMRQVTERPEGLWAGTVKLVGTTRAIILTEVKDLLEDPG